MTWDGLNKFKCTPSRKYNVSLSLSYTVFKYENKIMGTNLRKIDVMYSAFGPNSLHALLMVKGCAANAISEARRPFCRFINLSASWSHEWHHILWLRCVQ